MDFLIVAVVIVALLSRGRVRRLAGRQLRRRFRRRTI
jgi:hypothetical protein